MSFKPYPGHQVTDIYHPPNWSMRTESAFKCECGETVDYEGSIAEAYLIHIARVISNPPQ